MMSRREAFYADVLEAAHRKIREFLEKDPPDIDQVVFIGECKRDISKAYEDLEELDRWFQKKGSNPLDFFFNKLVKGAQRDLTIELFNLVADRLGTPHYEDIRGR